MLLVPAGAPWTAVPLRKGKQAFQPLLFISSFSEYLLVPSPVGTQAWVLLRLGDSESGRGDVTQRWPVRTPSRKREKVPQRRLSFNLLLKHKIPSLWAVSGVLPVCQAVCKDPYRNKFTDPHSPFRGRYHHPAQGHSWGHVGSERSSHLPKVTQQRVVEPESWPPAPNPDAAWILKMKGLDIPIGGF